MFASVMAQSIRRQQEQQQSMDQRRKRQREEGILRRRDIARYAHVAMRALCTRTHARACTLHTQATPYACPLCVNALLPPHALHVADVRAFVLACVHVCRRREWAVQYERQRDVDMARHYHFVNVYLRRQIESALHLWRDVDEGDTLQHRCVAATDRHAASPAAVCERVGVQAWV